MLTKPIVFPLQPLSTGQPERPRTNADDWEYLRKTSSSWQQLRFLNYGLVDPADPTPGLTENTSFGGRDYLWIVQGQGARVGSYVGLTTAGTIFMQAQAGLTTDWSGGAMDATSIAFKTDLSQSTTEATYSRLETFATLISMRVSFTGPYVQLSHWVEGTPASLQGFGPLCLGTTTLFGYASRGTPAGAGATGQNFNTATVPFPHTWGKSSDVTLVGNLAYYEQTYYRGSDGTRPLQTANFSNYSVSAVTSPMRCFLTLRTLTDAAPTTCEVSDWRSRVRRDWFYEVGR